MHHATVEMLAVFGALAVGVYFCLPHWCKERLCTMLVWGVVGVFAVGIGVVCIAMLGPFAIPLLGVMLFFSFTRGLWRG